MRPSLCSWGSASSRLSPCRESGSGGSEPRQGQVVANGAACVRALEGAWAGPRQLVLIGNLDQPSVEIANGDIVGAVLLDGVAGNADQELPEVAHVWQDWDTLHDIAELDVPCPEYYDALRTHRRSQFAGASEVVLEHLDALD